MIQLRIKESRRTFQCDVAGCRNRTNFLISKRDDVASRPIHLCRDCIRGLAGLLDDIDGVTATAPKTALQAAPVNEEPEAALKTTPNGEEAETAQEAPDTEPIADGGSTAATAPKTARTRTRRTTAK